MIRSVWRTISLSGWQEALGLTLMAVVLPWLLFSSDPLLLETHFFWPIIGPLLVALRYGFGLALCSVLGVILFQLWALFSGVAIYIDPYPFEAIAAYVLAVLVAGEFRDAWARRIEQLEKSYAYSQGRLRSFAANYHLLQTSHHRMEQAMAGHALSLRESMQSIRNIFAEQKPSLEGCASQVLDLFVEYGGFQTAGLFGVNNGNVDAEPVASVGRFSALIRGDQVMAQALETGHVIAVDQSTNPDKEHYQLAVPVCDAAGTLHAIVLVEQVQFFSLTDQNLTLLAVMAGHIGDSLRESYENPLLVAADRAYFMRCIERAQIDAEQHGVSCQLIKVSSQIADKEVRLLYQYVSSTRRGLDLYFQQDEQTWLVLMPLTEESDARAFLHRLERWSTERLGKTLDEVGVSIEAPLSFPLATHTLASMVNQAAPEERVA
ncbi:PelD GGDEF domain-containing protein [Neptunomonas sp. XY-337]|uniref:PelD GGDEF domain-containing protein n=1 Tax=Neptunomonas sp. XY-337 TaxID=2561897 RepID=UPI0010AA6F26|nr:PelD GGDEF domain-containing protein [Neptunomonas sp. XY-337]